MTPEELNDIEVKAIQLKKRDTGGPSADEILRLVNENRYLAHRIFELTRADYPEPEQEVMQGATGE